MNILEINPLNGNVIGINSTVPDFLEIKNGINGVGIFTKKPFKKGEVVYSTNSFALPIDNLTEEIKIRTNMGEFTIIKDIHASEDFLYGWDSFLNHNCNCNLKDFDEYEKNGQAFYSKIAIRDIEVGEELYVNYNEFSYDFEGKGVFKCSCGYNIVMEKLKASNMFLKRTKTKFWKIFVIRIVIIF